ncbi:MAG: BatD family protein [Saprospiraceae bacterium]|nr:BatD family protein [Saprospiraceae bacterium]
MKSRIIFLLLSIFFCGSLQAQEGSKFTVTISTDSILLGNYFMVTFTLENAEGSNFQPPVFEGFNVISGPNTSSSFSMINGDVTQSVAYSYYLEPMDVGSYYIAPASIDLEDRVLETLPLEVNVYPNPEGIKQRSGGPMQQQFEFKMDDFFSFPEFDSMFQRPREMPKKKEKKKKRKTYKI